VIVTPCKDMPHHIAPGPALERDPQKNRADATTMWRMRTTRLSLLAVLFSTLALETSAGAVASAELGTYDGYRYGRFEARIWFPDGDGIVGAYFLWKNGSEMPDTYWNELDFEKVRAECAMQLNAIYGRPQAGHESMATGLTGSCSAYHLYVFEWTPSYISWQVDGAEVRRDTGATAQAFADNTPDGMQFRFNIWPGDVNFGGTFSESSLPAYQLVSWAAYSAYTPGAGDDGTDFSLRWRESFETGRPAGWLIGSWVSPLQHSMHSPANVVFTDGVAVLALTADSATGFTGTPPADPDDMPTVHVPVGGAGGSDTPGAGGSDDGGCGCRVPGGAGSGAPLLGLALVAAATRRRGTRGRATPAPARR
jgi:hypothetical protein